MHDQPAGELQNGQRNCECWAAGLAHQHSWHFERCMPMINCSSSLNKLWLGALGTGMRYKIVLALLVIRRIAE
jgi:hypothetical protein